MPSRASFMTGCYPHQTGVLENGQELDADFELTAARCMRAAGYHTVQIGKLHHQCHEDFDQDPRARHDYGFDVFWCDEEPGCYDGPYLRWLASEAPDELNLFRVPRPTAPGRTKDATHPKVLDAPWTHSFSGWIAEQCERYLHSWGGSRGKQKRQFMHLGFYAPHPPLNPTRDMMEALEGQELPPLPDSSGEWQDKPDPLAWQLRNPALPPEQMDEYRRHMAAMVTGIDFAVGQVLTGLEQAGILEDSLIVVCSDHGDYNGDHGLILKGPAGYDGVYKVPLFLHWPKGLEAGRREPGLVELVDLLPTLLGLAEQQVPAAMSGCDWSSHLRAESAENLGREDVFAQHAGNQFMLRTAEWKYLRFHADQEHPTEVLYDLKQDPGETRNRAEDPACAEILSRMRERCFQRLTQASRSLKPRRLNF